QHLKRRRPLLEMLRPLLRTLRLLLLLLARTIERADQRLHARTEPIFDRDHLGEELRRLLERALRAELEMLEALRRFSVLLDLGVGRRRRVHQLRGRLVSLRHSAFKKRPIRSMPVREASAPAA